MSADRDMTRIVRSWLRTDEHESADRVLDDVLALLDATPQRGSPWPARRIADMNTFAKLAVAAAAVMVVAVIGIDKLPAGDGVGSAGPAASLRPSPSPRSVSAYPPEGTSIPIGRHSVTVDGVPLSFTLLTRSWESHDGLYMSKNTAGPQGGEAVIFWTSFPGGVNYIPCTDLLGSSDRPSVAELAAAVSTVPGTDVVSGPSDVTVGGRGAKHVALFVTYNVLDGVYCDPGFFYSWTADDVGATWAGTVPGDTIRVWIVDVDGTRLFIEAATHWNAGPEVGREIQRIVDSIEFG